MGERHTEGGFWDKVEPQGVNKGEGDSEPSAKTLREPKTALVWSIEKPTVSGWYFSKGDWQKDNTAMEVVQVDVTQMRASEYWDRDSEDWIPLPDNAIWAGPIQEPTHPAVPQYRLLKVGEVIREGDMALFMGKSVQDQGIPTFRVGCVVAPHSSNHYYRPITPLEAGLPAPTALPEGSKSSILLHAKSQLDEIRDQLTFGDPIYIGVVSAIEILEAGIETPAPQMLEPQVPTNGANVGTPSPALDALEALKPDFKYLNDLASDMSDLKAYAALVRIQGREP